MSFWKPIRKWTWNILNFIYSIRPNYWTKSLFCLKASYDQLCKFANFLSYCFYQFQRRKLEVERIFLRGLLYRACKVVPSTKRKRYIGYRYRYSSSFALTIYTTACSITVRPWDGPFTAIRLRNLRLLHRQRLELFCAEFATSRCPPRAQFQIRLGHDYSARGIQHMTVLWTDVLEIQHMSISGI